MRNIVRELKKFAMAVTLLVSPNVFAVSPHSVETTVEAGYVFAPTSAKSHDKSEGATRQLSEISTPNAIRSPVASALGISDYGAWRAKASGVGPAFDGLARASVEVRSMDTLVFKSPNTGSNSGAGMALVTLHFDSSKIGPTLPTEQPEPGHLFPQGSSFFRFSLTCTGNKFFVCD